MSVLCVFFLLKTEMFFFPKGKTSQFQFSMAEFFYFGGDQNVAINWHFLALCACCISHHLCLQCAMLRLREDAHLLGRFTIIAEEVPQMSSRGKLEMLVKSRASQEEIGARREQVGWTAREEQGKEGQKTILSVEGGVKVHLFQFVVSFLELPIKPSHGWGWKAVNSCRIIATWHRHGHEASKKSKGAKAEEDEEMP